MIRSRKVLAIGAHPDDIEYGCLGFLLKNPGDREVNIYVASLGSVGDPSTGHSRKEESLSALSILSPRSLTFREKTGIGTDDFNSILDQLTGIISEFSPDLILCHGPHDTHQEHRQVFEITIAAARRSRASILAY